MNGLMRAALIATMFASTALPAVAGELITNGNFETGTLTGWTKTVQAGSAGNVYVVANNGGQSPESANNYAYNSMGGAYFAITDQHGPGSYALTQAFATDGMSDIQVKFQLFANNQIGTPYVTSPDRDFSVVPNQNVEVDILTGSACACTTEAADIVATLYGPTTSGAGANPWVSYAFDLGVLAAGTYQFRFAETDNMGFLQGGIDNIEVLATAANVPEPATLALLGFGIVAIQRVRRTGRRARQLAE